MAPMTWDQAQGGAPTGGVPEGTEPTPSYEPADFGEGSEKTQVATPTFDLKPRFTGRASAIAALQQITDTAFDNRELGFAVVIGEPGMGKSRIAAELVQRVRTLHPSALVLCGIADENSHAYGPIARSLTAKFGLVAGEGPEESRDKIEDGVAAVLPPQKVPEVAHLIAHLLRVPFDDSPVVTPLLESPQRLEARLFMALKRLLAAEAEQRPVLVMVENL